VTVKVVPFVATNSELELGMRASGLCMSGSEATASYQSVLTMCPSVFEGNGIVREQWAQWTHRRAVDRSDGRGGRPGSA
jgi:hypothetical protein